MSFSRSRSIATATSAHLVVVLLSLTVHLPRATADVPSPQELVQALKVVDDRQRNQGDWQSLLYIEHKERDQIDTIYQALVFRRSAEQKFMILFTKPKVSEGQGYLRLDKNLWSYDPTVGKWERRTERERIGGTNARRSDFDESRLAEEYDPEFQGEEKLGSYTAQVLSLKGKAGLDLPFPVIKVWLDKATGNVLKRQEFALSGRLLRTAYFPRWTKRFSDSKQADIWFPLEQRFFDEVEKDNQTLIITKTVDVKPLGPNIFTKAWLEGKSR
jgi:hypothetical protein